MYLIPYRPLQPINQLDWSRIRQGTVGSGVPGSRIGTVGAVVPGFRPAPVAITATVVIAALGGGWLKLRILLL
jgi:hypothetical protein